MTRAPDGTRPQPKTDAALFAHIAYRLEDVDVGDLGPYASTTLRIAVGENAIRKAPSTADRVASLPGRPLRPWLLVDAEALDLFSAAVHLRNADDEAFGQIAGIPGVIQLMRMVNRRDLLAIVIFERRSDQRALRARLGELARIVSWSQIDFETHEPAIVTWRSLAYQAAKREGLA